MENTETGLTNANSKEQPEEGWKPKRRYRRSRGFAKVECVETAESSNKAIQPRAKVQLPDPKWVAKLIAELMALG